MRKLVLVFLAIIPIILIAQNRLTPEKLWDIKRIGLESVNANGDYLIYGLKSYVLEENKGYRHLYKMQTDGSKPFQLTSGKVNDYNAKYKPNSTQIGFIRSGNLWEVSINGGEAKKVSDIKMTSFKYSNDGKYIVYSADVEYKELKSPKYPDLPLASARLYDDLMYRHWSSWEDDKKSNIFIAKIEGDGIGAQTNIVNKPFDSPLNPFGGAEEYSISPDGKWVAYTLKEKSGLEYAKSTNSDVYLYNIDNKQTINISSGMKGYDKAPVFSPDSKKIIWSSMAREGYEADINRLFIWEIGGKENKQIAPNYDGNINHPAFSKDGSKIYFGSGKNATLQIYALDLATEEIEQLTKGRVNYYDFLVTEKALITRRCDMMNPHELYRVELSNKLTSRLSFVTEDVMADLDAGRVKEHWVKTFDGQDMLVWLIYPPNFDPEKKYPALLYCQGGPQAAVNQFFSFRWNFNLMAANDYIIVAPNRRGLPSFGSEWNESISKDWSGGAMKDYLTAIDDALSFEKAIDKDRVGAIGASYGGYSVYWLAGNHEKRFKSFLSHCGLFNLESWYGTTEELFFANWDIGGPYWDKTLKEDYNVHSPHRYVQNWDTPILVIHGEKDFRVPIGEGMQAFQAAKLKGVDAKFLYYPDEGHWVLGPQNGVYWHREFFNWLDTYLK